MGANTEPNTRNAAIHELSSLVMGSGESSAISMGRDGDVQPYEAAAARIMIVTECRYEETNFKHLFDNSWAIQTQYDYPKMQQHIA